MHHKEQEFGEKLENEGAGVSESGGQIFWRPEQTYPERENRI